MLSRYSIPIDREVACPKEEESQKGYTEATAQKEGLMFCLSALSVKNVVLYSSHRQGGQGGNMNRTKIEWCDYTMNPVKGLCPMACPYCYARAMYKRFKWNPEIRFVKERITMPAKVSSIFVGSTIELFGDWIKDEWLKETFNQCERWQEHTFIFLTKQPQNLIKWSPFPENCWVGVTATNQDMFERGIYHIRQIKAKVIFMSFEPLMERIKSIHVGVGELGWLIIGQQTPISAKTQPKIGWIQEIVEAADKAGSLVFLKDNLKPLLTFPEQSWAYIGNCHDGYHLRQECPKC